MRHGGVLCGQLSFWGAAVITSLAYGVPILLVYIFEMESCVLVVRVPICCGDGVVRIAHDHGGADVNTSGS